MAIPQVSVRQWVATAINQEIFIREINSPEGREPGGVCVCVAGLNAGGDRAGLNAGGVGAGLNGGVNGQIKVC